MQNEWTATPQAGLETAIAEFQAKLPGWWYTLGECSLSSDASCGPDRSGSDSALLASRQFDEGFHADLPKPASLADALRDVTAQGLAALALVMGETVSIDAALLP